MYISQFFNYKHIDNNKYVLLYNELDGKKNILSTERFNQIVSSISDINAIHDNYKLTELNELGILFSSESVCQKNLFSFYEKQRLNYPIVEQVELTNACAYKCKMCPRTYRMNRPIGFIDLQLFSKICEQILPYQRFISLHHFGDPLHYPHLAEAISIASTFGINTGLSCNAASMNATQVIALQEAGLSSITFCLDSLHNERYQRIRGTKKTVEQNISMIKQFVEISKKFKTPTLISLQMIQMKENHDEGNDFIKFAQNLKVDSGRVISFGQWDFSDEEANKMAYLSQRPLYKPACPVRWESVSVLWDGSVVPCCRDYNGEIVLGNVSRNTLNEIWLCDTYLKLRQNENQFTRCRNCWSSWHYKEKKRAEVGFLEFHRQKEDLGNPLQWMAEGATERYEKIFFPVEFRIARKS